MGLNEQIKKSPFVFAETVDTLGGNEPVIAKALTKLNCTNFGSIARKAQNKVCVSL